MYLYLVFLHHTYITRVTFLPSFPRSYVQQD